MKKRFTQEQIIRAIKSKKASHTIDAIRLRTWYSSWYILQLA